MITAREANEKTFDAIDTKNEKLKTLIEKTNENIVKAIQDGHFSFNFVLLKSTIYWLNEHELFFMKNYYEHLGYKFSVSGDENENTVLISWK
jgi:CMP-2-keto-3-deoxyoctulosonic acid synthetase